jgi:hypothetical protein
MAAPRRDRGPHARDDRPAGRRREQATGIIPGARLRFLDGVAHVPHLEGDPETLGEIAAFVDAFD